MSSSRAGEATQHNVPIDYEPALVEAVVTAYMAKLDCPPELGPRAFHRRADRLYALPVETRERRFRELFADWFARAGFPELFNQALAEFPDITGRVARVLVVRADSRADERADLSNLASAEQRTASPAAREGWRTLSPLAGEGWGGGGAPTWLGIRIRPERLFDAAVRPWLRHELWHVRDMLDPAFQYQREGLDDTRGLQWGGTPRASRPSRPAKRLSVRDREAVAPAPAARPFVAGVNAPARLSSARASRLPERLIQDRYRILWSLSIDARVTRCGTVAYRSPEVRLVALRKLLPRASQEACRRALEAIGSSCALTHPEIMELARRPAQLLPAPAARCGTRNAHCASAGDHCKQGIPNSELRTGTAAPGTAERSSVVAVVPAPGSPCPLCGFPTFDWAAATDVAAATRAICARFSTWSPEHGACRTCYERLSGEGEAQ